MTHASRRALFLIALAVFAASVVLIVLAWQPVEADDNSPGTRGPGDYQGAQNCGTCHNTAPSTLYDNWTLSRHASAWDSMNNSTDRVDSCEVCHTTGAGDEAHNGFNVTTDQPDYLKNVQCEACHGPDPHSDPQTASSRVNFSATTCGSCHNRDVGAVHHPYFDEWSQSAHSLSLQAAGGAVVDDPSCRSCHVAQAIVVENFEGGTLTAPVDNPEPIVCAVCHDPHGSVYANDLRLPRSDLCAACHTPSATRPGEEVQHPQSFMREGLSGLDIPQVTWMADVECADCHLFSSQTAVNVSKTGHTFRPTPNACADCHDGIRASPQYTIDQAGALIDTWQDWTGDRVLNEIQPALFEARQAIDGALDLGFTSSQVATAREVYDEANYSANFVIEDRSWGVHNPPYTEDLLNHALERAQWVTTFLQPGSVTGRLVDDTGAPVAGALISRLGRVYATTDADGYFAFEHAWGTHDFDILMGRKSLGQIRDVQIDAGAETSLGNVEVSPPVSPDYTPLILGLVAIMLAIVAISLVLVRRQRREPPRGEEE